MSEVGPTLRRLRHARGLTQGELADRIGSTQNAISRAERMQRPPGMRLLKRLCAGLGVRLRVKLVPEESR